MADTRNILKLDEKLIQEKIVDDSICEDYKKVHRFLNTHMRKNGKILTEENFEKGDQALREWLMVLYKKGASQEKLTSYLRVGLAHLCYDFVESGYSQIDSSDLITRALLSFKNRKYHKTFFKISLLEASSSRRGRKEQKARKKALKRSAPKKTASGRKKPTPKPKKQQKKKRILSFFKF